MKNENSKSIRELSRFLNEDIKISYPEIKELEE